MNNKSQGLFDIIYIGIILMGMVMFVTIGYYVVSQMSGMFQSTEGNENLAEIETAYTSIDKAIPFFLALFYLVMIISAWLFAVNPIFMMIHLILLITATIIMGNMELVLETFLDASTFSSVISNMPNLERLGDNIGMYGFIGGSLMMVVMFARTWVST